MSIDQIQDVRKSASFPEKKQNIHIQNSQFTVALI